MAAAAGDDFVRRRAAPHRRAPPPHLADRAPRPLRLLRIPSFLEPHWYTDEAGYVTTARALLQGKVLYSQIWTNKPPLEIWTVAAVIHFLGTSEVTLHAVTFLTGLLTLLAVAYAANRLLGRRRAVVALVLAAIMLGTPLLDAELILPESLLIAPMAWAGALLLTRVAAPDTRRWPLWPVAVGALAAAGIAYQQTALADTFVFGLILATAGQASWRRVATFTATRHRPHRGVADPRPADRGTGEGRLRPGRLLGPVHPGPGGGCRSGEPAAPSRAPPGDRGSGRADPGRVGRLAAPPGPRHLLGTLGLGRGGPARPRGGRTAVPPLPRCPPWSRPHWPSAA